MYYPDRIADDDDDELSSSCSAEIEGGGVVVADDDPRTPGRPGSQSSCCNEDPTPTANGVPINDGCDEYAGSNSHSPPPANNSLVSSSKGRGTDRDENEAEAEGSHPPDLVARPSSPNDAEEEQLDPTAALIENERIRRLGVRDNATAMNNNERAAMPRANGELPSAPNSGGVLGNIRGWFGGGGGVGGASSNQSPAPSKKPQSTPRRSSAPVTKAQNSNPQQNLQKKGSDGQSHNQEDDDSSYSSSSGESSDDESSSSQSCNSSDSEQNGDVDLTPQERARARALRYLSNSCVDAGRKAKTASYIRGLERLDLKRKRDRYEKELEIVESEMNKDRGLINNGEEDAISNMAKKLVSELPRVSGIQGADAGAGSDVGKAVTNNQGFMTIDEYVDALNGGAEQHIPVWENKEAVDAYVASLQSRLKETVERTKSLEKRLVILEQTGDDIVSSLCEDLADITGHSNKTEARYVKKGKELQRKRRREELRYRNKIKQAERRIGKLEDRLMFVSGDQDFEQQPMFDPKSYLESDSSNEESSVSGDNGEDDEILLERKLSTIKTKNGQDKDQHESEVESIRRQCEQLKLRLSVARLVMEGDDNLREYIALLNRMNPSTRHQHRNSAGLSDTFGGQELPETQNVGATPSPPSRITRARAKLLKAIHLERIYKERLTVSKAFTDATINALDQELIERETASQKMEVRCINELVLIDSGIKDIVKESNDKITELETEAGELEDAIAACAAQKSITNIEDMFGDHDASADPFKPRMEAAAHMDCTETNERSMHHEEENGGAHQSDAEQDIIVDDSSIRSDTDENGDEAANNDCENQAQADLDADSPDHVIVGNMSLQDASESAGNTVSKASADADIMSAGSIEQTPFDATNNSNEEERISFRLDRTSDDASSDESEELKSSQKQALHAERDLEATTEERADFGELAESDAPSQPELYAPDTNETKQSTDDRLANREDDASESFKDGYQGNSLASNNGEVVADVKSGDICVEKASEMTSQKKAVIELLGNELKCTLAEYQTSYDLSSSSDRVEQLEYMNNLVIKIAKIRGIDCPDSSTSEKRELVRSWSRRDNKEHRDKKRSKKKKKRRAREKEKKGGKKDEPKGLVLSLTSGQRTANVHSLVW